MNNLERMLSMLIEQYKQNINPPSAHIRVAEVIDTNPIRIRWGEGIVIESDKLIIPQIFKDGYELPYTYRYMNTVGNMIEETKEIILRIELIVGDKVIVAPDEYLRNWHVLEKVGE